MPPHAMNFQQNLQGPGFMHGPPPAGFFSQGQGHPHQGYHGHGQGRDQHVRYMYSVLYVYMQYLTVNL